MTLIINFVYKSKMLSPIAARPYLRTEVYDALRGHVLSLAATIDEPVKLSEEELARMLGVSRTPVREALRRLEQEGVVSVEPRRGARLMPVTLEEYLEWLAIREMLEGLAARLCAETATAADIARLSALFAEFDDEAVAARPVDYAKANVAFHQSIAEIAGSALLERTWRSFGHAAMAGLRFIERLRRGQQSLVEHRAIIAAIAAGDPDAAERAGRDHVRSLREAARALDTLTSDRP
ncbi:GntR family transcriptional regulator [Bosea vestrisii]|uniref:GntR family transcriptional regulator n=1 Tax=Bosea vestrisii TaxID=151416 RepID=UPI0024DF7F4B|nr:GntR family transcriptional regulator [Bosea vestrisii]WID95235.1 GntR family transcriptional regulator [Bosea vestrisii]